MDKDTSETVAVYLASADIQAVEQLQALNGIPSFSAAMRHIIREWAAARADNAKKIKTAVRAKAATIEAAR